MTTRRDDHRVFNELVLRLYRMLKVGSMHLPNNAAVHQAVEQCARILPELDGTDMRRLRLLFVDDTVYVNGRLLKADRQTFELAAELGHVVESLGFNELTVSGQASDEDLLALAASFHEPWTGAPDGVDLRSIDPEALASLRDDGSSSRDKLIRTYTSTVVVMRWVYESLLDGRIRAPRNLKRLVQQLAVLADEEPKPFLHLAAGPNLHDDDGGRAVKAAIVAIAMARALVDDVRTLSRIGLTALLMDLGRTRAARLDLPEDAPRFRVLPALNDAQLERLPASTAAVLTAVGRLQGDAMERARLAWLAQQLDVAAIFDGPRIDAPFEARIVRIARQWADALAFDVRAQSRRTPDEVFDLLTQMASDDDEARVVRLLGRVLELGSDRPRPAAPSTAAAVPPGERPGRTSAPYEIVTAAVGGAFATRDTDEVGALLDRWFESDASGQPLTAEVMGPPDDTEAEVLDAWFGDDAPDVATDDLPDDSETTGDARSARSTAQLHAVAPDAVVRGTPPPTNDARRHQATGTMWKVRAHTESDENDAVDTPTAQVPEQRTRELLEQYDGPRRIRTSGTSTGDVTTEQISEARSRELLDAYDDTSRALAGATRSGSEAGDSDNGDGDAGDGDAATARVSNERTQELLERYTRGEPLPPPPEGSRRATGPAESTASFERPRVRDLLAAYLMGDEDESVHNAGEFTTGDEATVQLRGRHASRLVGEARKSSFERALQARLGESSPPREATVTRDRDLGFVTTQPPSRTGRDEPPRPPRGPAAPPPPVASRSPLHAAPTPTHDAADDPTVQLDERHAHRLVGESRQSSFERALQRRLGDQPDLNARREPSGPRAIVSTPPPSKLPPPVVAERLPIQEAPTPEADARTPIPMGGPGGVEGFVARRREEQLSGSRDAVRSIPEAPTPAHPVASEFDDSPPSREEISTEADPTSAPGGWVRRTRRKRSHATTGEAPATPSAPSSREPSKGGDPMDALLRAYLTDGDD